MRFICLHKPSRTEGLSPSEQEMAEMGRLIEEMVRVGALIATEGCQPSAKGARVRLSRGEFTVTDGPFTVTRELIAGVALIQAESREEAIEWTKHFLSVSGDGETEIRQLHDASDCPSDSAPELGEADAGAGAQMAVRV